ncbi:4a-hydroxytetrahydrobiopterin dehydratase [Falsihalocynthiibacter sp. SS001]|uniref:4a-hydroxytetrahydrobiopterin dehydratase n=1 Tax=Falsihalocynthiibacter sp. SS001 TaxID=3349698 RepID=UPI0036D2EA9D
MSDSEELSDKACIPCEKGGDPLATDVARDMLAQLADGWEFSSDGNSLRRKYSFKGYAKPVYIANAAAFLADQQGHHPDVRFGWGYCEIEFTTHAIGGLSENDFICAAKLDQITAT